VVRPAILDAALTAQALRRRQRTLPRRFMWLMCLLITLVSDEARPPVCARLTGSWRGDGGHAARPATVSAGALGQARSRLGGGPLVALFRLVCQPLAPPDPPGAGGFGRCRLALASTHRDEPETLPNVAVFGRHQAWRGPSAWPQARLVLLVAWGTHAIRGASSRSTS
jgi:hypothetical protein